MRSRPVLFATMATLALIASACGSDSTATTTAASSTSTADTSSTPTDVTTTTRSTSGVTLEPPSAIGAGTEFTVAWTGPDNDGDYVTIVPVGSADGVYESYFYTRLGPEGTLVAPTTSGEYEIRYVDGDSTATIYTITVTVSAYSVSLDAPDQVEGGTEFEVSWTGPDGPGDYITVVPVGADAGTYDWYFYTTAGPTGTLVAPIEEGAHEVRYVSGNTSETLGSLVITVTPYIVTLSAPDQVEAGSTFEVTWTGPNGPSDYITIVKAGAPVGSYLDYRYTAQGSPATLTAPTEPGDYEIRYASDRVTQVTFASIPIEVK